MSYINCIARGFERHAFNSKGECVVCGHQDPFIATNDPVDSPVKDDRGNIWPAQLEIRDTQIYDDNGGRIYTTTGNGYKMALYIRADVVADQLRTAASERDRNKRRADHAYPYPEAEDWTVEELAEAYRKLLNNSYSMVSADYCHQRVITVREGERQHAAVVNQDLEGRLRAAVAALEECKQYIPPVNWPRHAEQVLAVNEKYLKKT